MSLSRLGVGSSAEEARRADGPGNQGTIDSLSCMKIFLLITILSKGRCFSRAITVLRTVRDYFKEVESD